MMTMMMTMTLTAYDDDNDDDDVQERGGEWSIEFLADDLPQGEVEREQVIVGTTISSDHKTFLKGGP